MQEFREPRDEETMSEERYILECPHCGRVEGYVDMEDDEEGDAALADSAIVEEEVQTREGPAMRVRCPRCGRWTRPDRARPA
jgi:hypothetical protein